MSGSQGMSSKSPVSVDWAIDLFDHRLRQIHAYWTSLHRGNALPLKSDLRPTDLRAVLPYVFLADVLQEPKDFLLRLVGTHFETFAEQKLTGKRVTEAVPQDFGETVLRLWGEAVDTRRPLHAVSRLWIPTRRYVRWEGVVLPLVSETGTVEQLLGGIVFSYPTETRAA